MRDLIPFLPSSLWPSSLLPASGPSGLPTLALEGTSNDAGHGPHERVYLVGGATAVIEGWRESTLDVDLQPGPDAEAALRAIPAIDPPSFRRAVKTVTGGR